VTDLLDELRDANPVDAGALEVPPRLSARVLRRAPADARRTRRLRVCLAVMATAAAVCVIILLLPGGRGGTPSLASRAYAATSGDGVIHWRTEQHTYLSGHQVEHRREEGWARNGVTHIVRYAVRRGNVRLIDDSRTADRRLRMYLASSDDYLSTRVPNGKGISTDPLASGDPFATFRRAFRTGKLTRLGPRRYAVDLPGDADDGISAIYELDPRTALPTRFTLSTSVVSRAKRYDNKLVMRFETYERLPFTPANRAKLRLLPHPGAGPKHDPAAAHFAVLRGARRPGSGAMRAINRLADQQQHFALDASAARAISPGHYLVPGHGYICLATSSSKGFGAGCVTIAHAVKHGVSTGNPVTGITVGVPDGVKALRARERGGKSETVRVHDNHATLPSSAYQWQFVR
jgi:hypothetical protein